MNWACILKFCIAVGLNLAILFSAYRMGRWIGRREGYLDALDDMEKEIMIAMKKETKGGVICIRQEREGVRPKKNQSSLMSHRCLT